MMWQIGGNALVLTTVAAGVAGFVTGLAGFGTGLVAAGLWLQVLPAGVVPPLVVICSVAGQVASLPSFRRAISWTALFPYLAGAVVGMPLGVMALEVASPGLLRPAVGLFLVTFVAFETAASGRCHIGPAGGRPADALVGAGGGFLAGFAGLSGPVPIVWLRLRGGAADSRRAIYQPFNLFVLSATAALMALEGSLNQTVVVLAMACLPATLFGARIGVRCYQRIDPSTFRRVVLLLLLVSGLMLEVSEAVRLAARG